MQRFFIHSSLGKGYIIGDKDPLFHQIIRVLRMKKGERVIFFEALGDDIVYVLQTIEKRKLIFQKDIQQKKDSIRRIHPTITIFQALPHTIGLVDLLVQKLVELGVGELVFFRAHRSQFDISRLKHDRLQKIAQEALEQCGGNRPMKIEFCDSKEVIEKNYGKYFHIVGSLGQDMDISLHLALHKQQNIGFWVGPEGGWSDDEMQYFLQKKYLLWQFHPRILRLETATIVGTGILCYMSSKLG